MYEVEWDDRSRASDSMKPAFSPTEQEYNIRAVHSGGAKGAVAPARKTKCFFSNIVSDFAGLFLVAILVRNLTKTEFAPADKKS